jgi:hypothetical protein
MYFHTLDPTTPSATIQAAVENGWPVAIPADVYTGSSFETFRLTREDIFDLVSGYFNPSGYTTISGTSPVEVGKRYAVTGTSVLSLPDDAANGDVIEVWDQTATCHTNPISVGVTAVSDYIFDGQGNPTTVTFNQRGVRAFFVKDTSFGSAGRWACTVTLPPNSSLVSSARPPQTLTSVSGDIAWDVRNGANATTTLTEDVTLAFPLNAAAGSSGVLIITQDGTGSHTLAFGTLVGYSWVFQAATTPVITAAANKSDILNWYTPDGVTFYTSLVQNFYA